MQRAFCTRTWWGWRIYILSVYSWHWLKASPERPFRNTNWIYIHTYYYMCKSLFFYLFHLFTFQFIAFSLSISLCFFFCVSTAPYIVRVGKAVKRGAIYNDTHCHRLLTKNWLYVYRIRIRYKNVSGRGRKK